MLHHRRFARFSRDEGEGDDVFFSPLSSFSIPSIRAKRSQRQREREREEVSATRLNEKKKREGELGGGDWFRGINPLMLDVHAPAGTTSCTLDTCTRGISIIWIVKVFGRQLQPPNLCSPPPCRLSLSRRPLRETSHEYRRVPRISRLSRPWKSFRTNVLESPGCARGKEAFGIFVKRILRVNNWVGSGKIWEIEISLE